jgi:hypothetical protein
VRVKRNSTLPLISITIRLYSAFGDILLKDSVHFAERYVATHSLVRVEEHSFSTILAKRMDYLLIETKEDGISCSWSLSWVERIASFLRIACHLSSSAPIKSLSLIKLSSSSIICAPHSLLFFVGNPLVRKGVYF